VTSPANSELPDGSDAEPAPLLLRRARRLLDAVAAITNEVSSGTIGINSYVNDPTAPYEISRLYADARVQRIYGGTSETMREIIARSL
jgi:alkylation response protein AidB-like acyl-CoA dehydrogenase